MGSIIKKVRKKDELEGGGEEGRERNENKKKEAGIPTTRCLAGSERAVLCCVFFSLPRESERERRPIRRISFMEAGYNLQIPRRSLVLGGIYRHLPNLSLQTRYTHTRGWLAG